MFNAALSTGIAVPKNSDYKYIRDTFRPNVRRTAIIIITSVTVLGENFSSYRKFEETISVSKNRRK